jgi:hypothetical protein
MNPDTGEVYREGTKRMADARARGEKLVPISPRVAEQLRLGRREQVRLARKAGHRDKS